MAESVVAVENGRAIRPVVSARFGRVFMVDGTGKGGRTLEDARRIAREAPRKGGE